MMTFAQSLRSDAPAQNCGFNPVAAAAEQRRAAAESVKDLPKLKELADADAAAVASIEHEYNACMARAAELLPKMLAAQVTAGRSGERLGKALDAKRVFEREQQIGGA